MTSEPKPQGDKFKELARELECDENEAAFKAKLRKVARGSRPVTAAEKK